MPKRHYEILMQYILWKARRGEEVEDKYLNAVNKKEQIKND